MLFQPVLMLKVGVDGSEPRGFFEDLADVSGAYHYRDKFNSGGINLRLDGTQVKENKLRASSEIAEILASGRSVVYDTYIRHARERQRFFRVAAGSGVHAAAIVMQTPAGIVHDRLSVTHADVRSLDQSVPELTEVIKDTNFYLKQTMWPHNDDPQAIHLQGERSNRELIPQVMQGLSELTLRPLDSFSQL